MATLGHQLFLPLTDAITDRCRLQDSRASSARAESPRLIGKRKEAFDRILIAGPRGLTMREMAILTGRGINCWTQPFKDLRDWGLIRTTEEIREKGVVHVATGRAYEINKE